MRLTINTSDAQGRELAEPGPYLMNVEKIGDPRATEKTTVVDVDFAFADPDYAQRCGHIRRSFPVKGKGAGFFVDLIKVTTGHEIPIGKEGGDIDFDTDEILGKPVLVTVDNKPSTKAGADPTVLYNTAEKIVAA